MKKTITVIHPTVYEKGNVMLSHVTLDDSKQTISDALQECGHDIYKCIVLEGRHHPLLIDEMSKSKYLHNPAR